ncbi:hypothetical protein JL721_11035 [Aureococcus anophagefferens]|nr:hypothetical protein JL721_11035 [Aureococcus anophagefferens]
MAALTTTDALKPRVIIVPGNGCTGDVADANWYGWLAAELRREDCLGEVVLRGMPDPVAARESIWVPFLRDELGADERTIVVGHSSGAEAAMRLAETTRVLSLCLVRNAGSIHQWHGDDDPFIPLAEARHVAANLDSAYAELPGRSHFFSPPFPSSPPRRRAGRRLHASPERERAGLVDRRELDARPREGPGDGRDGRRVEPGGASAAWRPAVVSKTRASPVDDGAAT